MIGRAFIRVPQRRAYDNCRTDFCEGWGVATWRFFASSRLCERIDRTQKVWFTPRRKVAKERKVKLGHYPNPLKLLSDSVRG
jgi:hypothetical protein